MRTDHCSLSSLADRAVPVPLSPKVHRTAHATARAALPFVSSLCLQQRTQQAVGPETIDCAVLMVDICGYSRVTALLAHLGPRFLNHNVNTCLVPMLAKIESCGGDVLKFAGDAVFAAWTTSDMATNVRTAAATALWLQVSLVCRWQGRPSKMVRNGPLLPKGTVEGKILQYL